MTNLIKHILPAIENILSFHLESLTLILTTNSKTQFSSDYHQQYRGKVILILIEF